MSALPFFGTEADLSLPPLFIDSMEPVSDSELDPMQQAQQDYAFPLQLDALICSLAFVAGIVGGSIFDSIAEFFARVIHG